MTPDKSTREEQVEKMKQIFDAEREKHGYSVDDPVDPIRNKSEPLHLLGSILLTVLLVAAVTLIVSMVASENSGVSINLGSLLG